MITLTLVLLIIALVLAVVAWFLPNQRLEIPALIIVIIVLLLSQAPLK